MELLEIGGLLLFIMLLLLGGGHSHLAVLDALARRPVSDLAVTMVNPGRHAPYSGMLPGYIAGHYGYDDVHIDHIDHRSAGADDHVDHVYNVYNFYNDIYDLDHFVSSI